MSRQLIERFTCDNATCDIPGGRTADLPIATPGRANQTLPDGWSTVTLQSFQGGSGETKTALVCSEACASAFTKQALTVAAPTVAGAVAL